MSVVLIQQRDGSLYSWNTRTGHGYAVPVLEEPWSDHSARLQAEARPDDLDPFPEGLIFTEPNGEYVAWLHDDGTRADDRARMTPEAREYAGIPPEPTPPSAPKP